jgi:hypothetical protein
MSVSGDIREITWNHAVLGSGILLPKSSEDSTYNLGGFRSDDDANGIDGGGNVINKMTQTRWSFECAVAWDANDKEELEKLVALASNPVAATWTITSINGTVYGGKGHPVGEINGSGANGTIQLKVAGGGSLKKI